MRRWFLALLIFISTPLFAQTPTLVQSVQFGGAPNATTARKWKFPQVVRSGNTIIVGVQNNNAQTATVTDDKSGSYSAKQNQNDAGNSQRGVIYCRQNVTDGPQEISVNFTGGGVGYVSGFIAEFYNVNSSCTTDGTNGSTGSGTTRQPGSITTGTSGDLIVSYIAQTNIDAYVTDQVITSWTAPTNWTAIGLDRWVGQAAAWFVQSSAGAINPTWTISPSRTFVTNQVAFTPASQGTAPPSPFSGIRVVTQFHQGLDYMGSHSSPFVIQIPFIGNSIGTGHAIYCSFIGIRNPGNLTDSNGNTWTASGSAIINNTGGNSGYVRGYYSIGPTISVGMTMSLAFTGAGASPGDQLICSEMVGVAAFEVHTEGTTTGTGTSYATGTITPTKANGMIFATAGEDDHTASNSSPGVFLSSHDGDPAQCPSPCANDNNNAWALYQNPDTANVTITFTTDGDAGPVAWISDGFTSLAAVSGGKSLALTGVGQ